MKISRIFDSGNTPVAGIVPSSSKHFRKQVIKSYCRELSNGCLVIEMRILFLIHNVYTTKNSLLPVETYFLSGSFNCLASISLDLHERIKSGPLINYYLRIIQVPCFATGLLVGLRATIERTALLYSTAPSKSILSPGRGILNAPPSYLDSLRFLRHYYKFLCL